MRRTEGSPTRQPEQAPLALAFRRFVARAVRYLMADPEIRQFLDVGAGLPTVECTHEVAQQVAPDSRVVYVDNDPAVVARARALLASAQEGATAYVAADVHDTASILRAARETIDLAQPVGLILSGILGHVDYTAARSVVRQLMYELVPGSHLVVCDGTVGSGALDDTQVRRIQRDSAGSARYWLRGSEKIAAYFDGLDLVPPGVVPCFEWRPDPGAANSRAEVHAVGGVARKP